MKNYIIIISGATASGKSDLALKIAQEVNGEILNADIGSMYAPLTIGTAKPNWKSEKIMHHMFDILEQPINFTVVQFRERMKILIKEIWSRKRVPIIVGGSAFYIKALFYQQHEISDCLKFVTNLERDLQDGIIDSLQLWEQLNCIDSVRAQKIHPHDNYRIIRALAIFQATGKKPCEFEQMFQPLAPFYFIICKRDRQDLYQNINARVHTMMDQGWLDEVKALQNSEWGNFLLSKKIIGYDDLLRWLKLSTCKNLDETLTIIQQKTRNYAKRQIIFLKKLESDVKKQISNGQISGSVQEINLTYCDVGLYIKGLSKLILQTLS